MKISELKLREFVNERFDDVCDDYETLYELCDAIIKANELYDEGNSVAALELIRDYNNAALETKSYIDESIA